MEIQNKIMDKKLLSNTVFMYLLTLSSQILNLITIPYLTRVLGPVSYGKVGLALSYMAYVTIVLDFGFTLYATEKVVKEKDDKLYIGKLIYSVSIVKGVLGLVLFAILLGVKNIVDMSSSDFVFYLLYMIAYFVNAFLPDFFYRGIERMKTITYRTIFVKLIFTCMTFVFVNNETDYVKLPLFNLIGNILAVIIMYADMWNKYNIRLIKAPIKDVVSHMKGALPFFISRAASTAYQAMNTIVLSFIYGQSPILGYYTSADKIVTLSKTASSPIADSLYPYMIREKNFKGIGKFLKIVMPIIVILGVITFIFAEPICVFAFGKEYVNAGNVLRCLLPIMIVILPTYVICFPVMVPLGLSKYANRSNVVGMFIQIVGLLFLSIIGKLNIYSLCIISSLSEVSVFIYRLAVVVKFRHKQKIKINFDTEC